MKSTLILMIQNGFWLGMEILIDKQPTFDFFGVITYTTEYFAKDDTGTMEVLKQVIESNPDDDTKEKMKKVASTFLSHRQLGEAEAFFKLLPDLLLKKLERQMPMATPWTKVRAIHQNETSRQVRKRRKRLNQNRRS